MHINIKHIVVLAVVGGLALLIMYYFYERALEKKMLTDNTPNFLIQTGPIYVTYFIDKIEGNGNAFGEHNAIYNTEA